MTGGTTVGPYPTVRESFHVAMAAVRDLADEVGPVMTVHRLDGSAEQWVVLAAREGLAGRRADSARRRRRVLKALNNAVTSGEQVIPEGAGPVNPASE